MKYSFLFFLVLSAFSTGCGYSLQNSKNPLSEKEGIRRIYVEPVVNNSFKAGVENVVYNNMVRALLAHKRIIFVKNKDSADAILSAVVQNASYASSFGTAVSDLGPKGLASSKSLPTAGFAISTEYLATLTCSFHLTRTVPRKNKSNSVWSSSFVRTKPFSAANQLDVPGTTSGLINDSEFDRALAEISLNMMEDVHESMLAMF